MKKKPTFWEEKSDGTFHEIDPETKKVLSKAIRRTARPSSEFPDGSFQAPSIKDVLTHCKRWALDSGQVVWLPPGVTLADCALISEVEGRFERLLGEVCDQMHEGISYSKACKSLGLKIGYLNHRITIEKDPVKKETWQKKLEQARIGFAHACSDRQLEEAENADRSNVMEKTLLVNTLGRQAKVHDRGYFGDKLTHQGDAAKPIAFIIQTGVPQPDPKPVLPEHAPNTLPDIPIDAETVSEPEGPTL